MEDEEIKDLVEAALAPLGQVSPHVSVKQGVVRLEGFTRTEEARLRAQKVAQAVPGVRRVWNCLEVSWGPERSEAAPADTELERITHSPRGAQPTGPGLDEVREIDYQEPQWAGRAQGEVVTFHHNAEGAQEGLEPDFTEVMGTRDPLLAVEDADPYFPPTDPVVRAASDWEEGVEVVGGYTPTSEEELDLEGAPVSGPEPGDEQITEAVLRELMEDAATTSLRVQVFTRNGVVHLRGTVPTLLDAELAEEVAARVPGVLDVREELEVEERLPPR